MKHSPWFWVFSEPQGIALFPLNIKPWAPASERGSPPRTTGQCLCAVVIPPNKIEEGQL